MCSNNRYEVYYPGSNVKIFEIKEKSLCIERVCCYTCHEFTLYINNIIGKYNNIKISLEGDKKFKCGTFFRCWGCGKPKIEVNVKSPNNFFLGKITMNWKCCCFPLCTSSIDILDNLGNVVYVLKGNQCCCPVGFNCARLVKCCDIPFTIYKEKKKVGIIKKLSCDSCRICCTKADKYDIKFPPTATPEEKMLLIISALLIDHLSFFT